MKRRTAIKGLALGMSSLYLSKSQASSLCKYSGQGSAASASFLPNWNSLAQYKVPDWFRDAKFGIWAHWGPQCQAEYGDWYGRGMYQEGSDQYKYHCAKYGHPSKFGFKDVIHEWKGENWNPEELVNLYKNAGAKYFMAMANHHDNFDLFDSKYQSWNSTKLGPKKDLVAGWAKAAKNNGLPFGVSVHAAHTWSWLEPAQRADKSGPMAGVPYDGKLTAKEGKGKWWEGYDPQELYEQNHALSVNSLDDGMIHSQWNWGNGVTPPSAAYCEKFYKRILDLIDQFEPELIYFDDTALPLWPVNDAGLRIAAHHYNKSIKKHGDLQAVIFGKILDEQQRKCMVWDIERGQSNDIEPLPWQTDTCLGNWHYDRRVYNENRYKSAKTVIHTLVDVVSKNGNLLLNVPVRGDGTIDEKEQVVVQEVGEWMKVNGEGIYGTRSWTKYGEGPAMEASAPLSAQGFNESKGKPFSAEDIRFTTKNKVLYATLLGWPEADLRVQVKSLAATGRTGQISRVSLIGYPGKLEWVQNDRALIVNLPDKAPGKNAFMLKVEGAI